MTIDSRFRRLHGVAGDEIHFFFDGTPVSARTGDSVAAALLVAGHRMFCTSPMSGAARAPFCMMGACFECLVEIDGNANHRACMQAVAEGMVVRRVRGDAG